MLVGSDFNWSLVTGKFRMGKTGEPVAIETKFGWVLNRLLYEKLLKVDVTVVNDHFIKSVRLNNERRSETNLPFNKKNHPVFYDHLDLCKKRLEQLFKKLENSNNF